MIFLDVISKIVLPFKAEYIHLILLLCLAFIEIFLPTGCFNSLNYLGLSKKSLV